MIMPLLKNLLYVTYHYFIHSHVYIFLVLCWTSQEIQNVISRLLFESGNVLKINFIMQRMDLYFIFILDDWKVLKDTENTSECCQMTWVCQMFTTYLPLLCDSDVVHLSMAITNSSEVCWQYKLKTTNVQLTMLQYVTVLTVHWIRFTYILRK